MSGFGVKRVVIWGTGFVGRMVIAEAVKHPHLDLVGVGVSNPEKVGRDVGDLCGLGVTLGLTATDDVDALIDLRPDALVHYGPTAAHADANIELHHRHRPRLRQRPFPADIDGAVLGGASGARF